jgi:putative colanic acid biosynthesis acetyltransferase WcaB
MRFKLREYLRADYAANKGNPKGLFLVLQFRLANWFRRGGKFLRVIGIPYCIYYKFFIEWVIGFELPCSTQVGKGLLIHHGNGVVVNSKSKIGEGCCLLHQVTIGTLGDGDSAETPVIGDGVTIGVGAKVLGGVRVGNNARIGAATLVLKDVPADTIAIGNPMRLMNKTK